MSPATIEDVWLTTEEAMRYLRVARSTIARLMRLWDSGKGGIRYSKAPGIGPRFQRSALDEYLMSFVKAQVPPPAPGRSARAGMSVAVPGDDEIVPGTTMTRRELRERVGY